MTTNNASNRIHWHQPLHQRRRRGRRRQGIRQSQQYFFSSFSLFVVFLFLLLLLLLLVTRTTAHYHNMNPYRILGVTQQSKQDEIQKQYRKLCLQYHPDKNVQKSSKEKQKCEEQFKLIQQAYEQIGTPQKRQIYDMSSSSSSFSSSSSSTSSPRYSPSSPFGNDPLSEAILRAFQQGKRTTFYFSTSSPGGPRFGASTFTSNDGMPRPFSSYSSSPPFQMPAELPFKSIYKQTISVPLETLYQGCKAYPLDVVDNWWTRWRAAIRGKMVYISLYQGLLFSLPILKASKLLAFCIGIIIVHAGLPKPNPRYLIGRQANSNDVYRYRHSIPKGLKSPTSITIQSTSFGISEIVVHIVQEPHEIYQRHDNDLHATITITSTERQEGCNKRLPHPSGEDVTITIPPLKTTSSSTSSTTRTRQFRKRTKIYNRRTKNHTTNDTTRNYNTNTNDEDDDLSIIRIKGKGWPIRNAPNVYLYGDLIVRINVIPDDDDGDNKDNKKRKTNKKKKQQQNRRRQ